MLPMPASSRALLNLMTEVGLHKKKKNRYKRLAEKTVDFSFDIFILFAKKWERD